MLLKKYHSFTLNTCTMKCNKRSILSLLPKEEYYRLILTHTRQCHDAVTFPYTFSHPHSFSGKDITTKLYSLNEQLGVGSTGAGEGPRGGIGAQDVWRGVVQRSMSLDTVHTGTKGFVRSLAWRASRRRTSATYCDSVSEYCVMACVWVT